MQEGACVDYITGTCAQVSVSAHLHIELRRDNVYIVWLCHHQVIVVIETIIIGKNYTHRQ